MTNGNDRSSTDMNFVDRVSLGISWIAMFFVPVIVATIGYEIVMRYIFLRSSTWAKDLTVWVAVVGYLFAGLYVMQKRAHISITLLYDAVPRKVQIVFDVIKLLVILAFAGGLIIGAGPEAWRSFVSWERIGTSWNPPIPATVKPLILIVTFLIAVQAISNFITDLKRVQPKSSHTPMGD
ncbi:MAG: TRAP transporter small permease subunit [Hyphomicrobiaceae bacterium]